LRTLILLMANFPCRSPALIRTRYTTMNR
jgi:hypothetical protein